MNITINGDEQDVTDNNLLHIIATLINQDLDASGQPVHGPRLAIAVAVNTEVVPRSQWIQTAVAENDAIEVVTATQGG